MGDTEISSSSSRTSSQEVRPLNDQFRPHDYIRLIVSLMVVQIFFFF